MGYRVIFSPEARRHLDDLFDWIAREASLEVASRYIERIIGFCEGITNFPRRGSPRDEIRVGLRTLVFKRRVTIAYSVKGEIVTVVGIFSAGRNIEVVPEE